MPYLSTDGDFERIFMTSTEFVDQFVGASALLWGSNGSGQLGDGTTTSRSSPGTTAGGGTNWKQVAGGGDYSAAIKTDGTLWTWGSNGSGRLGDGTTTNRSSPVTTAGGGTNWNQVAGANNGSHTSAIKTDGTLWTWGLNTSGQLGDGTTTNRSSPITTAGGGTNWNQVAMGYEYTHAIKTDGTLWTWGHNQFGKLGDGTTTSRSSPVTVLGALTTTLYDTSSYQRSMIIAGSPTFSANTPFSGVGGSIYFDGVNSYVDSGASSDFILNADFTIDMWINSPTPTDPYLSTFELGAYTDGIMIRINTSDSIYINGGFGFVNNLNQYCINQWMHLAFSRTGSTLKIFVNGTQQYTGTFTATLNSTGQSVRLGNAADYNNFFKGNISNVRVIKGTGLYTSNFTTPTAPLTAVPNTVLLVTGTPIYYTAGWKKVSAGYAHTAAIKTDGTLWTWGSNGEGSLGTGGLTDRSSPGTTAGGGTNWKQLACGYRHVAAIKTDGTLWTWGQINYGKLGDGTDSGGNKMSPGTTVGGGTNWKQVSGGVQHTAAIKTDGTLWTWGLNTSGQLGDGTTSSRLSPIQPTNNLSNWKQIGCGATHVVAVAQN